MYKFPHLAAAFRFMRPFFLLEPSEHDLLNFVSRFLYGPLLASVPTEGLRFDHLERHRAQQKLYFDEQLSEFDLVQHLRDEVNDDFFPVMLASKNEGGKSEQLVQMESELADVIKPHVQARFTSPGPQIILTSCAVDTLIYASLLAFLTTSRWQKYIARCLECERIFVRERADKQFCCKTCRDTKNTRAWRHRSREMSIASATEMR